MVEVAVELMLITATGMSDDVGESYCHGDVPSHQNRLARNRREDENGGGRSHRLRSAVAVVVYERAIAW